MQRLHLGALPLGPHRIWQARCDMLICLLGGLDPWEGPVWFLAEAGTDAAITRDTLSTIIRM
jgi:hypothetical protein